METRGLNLTLDVNRVAHTVTYQLNNQGDDEEGGHQTIQQHRGALQRAVCAA
jgi:hypothetical protein